MVLPDGATAAQREGATQAGVSYATAYQMSGADLEYALLKKKAGGAAAALAPFSGADLEQKAWGQANIIATGESTYAAAGGKVTRIIGEGFTGATGVQAGGTNFTAFSVLDDNRIQATTPAKGAASYDLVVLHPEGNATLTNGITYV